MSVKFQRWGGSIKKYCECGKGNYCVIAINGKWMCVGCYEKTIEGIGKILKKSVGELVKYSDDILIEATDGIYKQKREQLEKR